MKTKTIKSVLASIIAAVSFVAFGIEIGSQVPGSDHSSAPCTPKQRTDDYHTQHFNADISGSRGKEFDIVLFGDSITDFWNNPSLALDGNPLNYAAAFNMGIGSDRVQNLLWRLKNGALDGYTTKYFTLMVGINNGHQKCIDHNEHADRAEDVAESIRLMLCEMATKHPDAKILLMPILPYSFDSKYFEAAEVTAMSEAVNDYILQFVDNKRVFWVDLRSQYLMQNSMPDKTCYREGGHGGYDAVGLCLHPEFFTYSDFWRTAISNAMHKYLSVPAGQAQTADPSLGYAKAAPNADGAGSATITVFGVSLGRDANANAVTSYSIDYELDGGAKTRALSGQTGTRASFVIPNVALGDHTCKVTVTTADNKELVTLLDFTMTEPWHASSLPTDDSAIRTDGTLKYAYASSACTVKGVTFAAAGNNNANISGDISWPYSQTSGASAPSSISGAYHDLLDHCWWANQGDKTVTLKNLTPGNTYLVQVFGYRNYNSDSKAHVWIKESYWDPNFIKVYGDGWSCGGVLTGTLTATEATKTFTITSDGNYGINAIQVRDLGESGAPVVVQPKIGSASATTNETAATVFLSGIVMGTDDAGTNATSYSVSYSLNNAAAVTALQNQTADTASFSIANLADGEYTCVVTITTDKNKTSAEKSVSFRIGPPPPEVVAPFIGSASVTTNGTTATIALNEITIGTDNAGVAASSYSVSYSLNSASAVTVLSNQSGATASFDISGLADGSYKCVVTITTDKNKTAETTVSFRIGEPPPITVGWTVGPMSANGSTIRTDGDLLYAYAAQNGTVGGVSFVRDAPLGAGGMVSASPVPAMGGGSWQTEGVSGDFGTMLQNGWNWTGEGTELSYTLTLAGLTPGKNYLVQLVMHRQSDNMLVSVNGSAQAHVHGSDEEHYKYGASIVGLFTASAATQELTVTYTERGGDRPLNAIQVRYLGAGGADPVDPVNPVDPVETPVYALTIPEKTGLTLQSVTTNGVAVAAAGGSYSIVSNTQVTVTFAAASGYEIVSGNPVVFTIAGAKTFVDADYPVVQTTGGGGGDPGPVPQIDWTVEILTDATAIQTSGTSLYAYRGASTSLTLGDVTFEAGADLSAANIVFDPAFSAANVQSASDTGTLRGLAWNFGVASGMADIKLTLNGLVTGRQYLVEILAHNSYGDANISIGDLTPVSTRSGQYATVYGSFTAESSSHDVVFKMGGAGGARYVNAIQVRDLGEGGGSSGATVVAPSIESASVTTNGTTATVSLSGIVMGTDDEGTNATSYAVSYSLTNAPAVTALSNQSGATASFDIENLADGEYTCEVTITTDKGKTASKAVSFTIGTSSGGESGDDMAQGCVLRISEILPKPTDARTLNGMEGMDVNGLESGWVEVENTSDKWADLADYRFIRVNRGKKTDPAGYGNFPSRLVPPHGRAIFYTSERYSNSKDKTVSAFAEGTFDGKPMIFENYGDILVWGDKVNPKKSPYVRLYYAPGGTISEVVDTVVIPSDLPEGWSIIVGDAAEGEGTRRWMCPTPTRGTENTATTGLVRIGPNVGPLYEKAGQGKTTYANEFAVPTPPAVPGTDYTVTLPINGVMNPDGTFTPRAADQIQSIKFVYRKDLDDATLVTNEVSLATKTTDANWGDQYTATIPSSYFPSAGHLMQWKVLITDGEGVEWTSPSFNNKDDGYEWYGTIVEPGELNSETLPTWHMFASGNHLSQMDKDANDQNLSLVPNNARIAIYDSSTSNYYDYVRIDLRGNTSAGFTKKGHGLRFAKSHPLTMQDVVTGEAVEEIRKTSLISEFADPSYMRQMVAFWLWRKMGNLVPFDFPVRCNLNGEFYQLAFNSERFTDELIEDVYGLDKFGYGYKNVGTMKSGSGTTAGGIEKKTPDDEDESNISVLQNELRSKITAAQQVSSSPDGGSTGLDNAALTKFVVQKFDLPAWLNYLASARITQEMDDVWANVCAYYDNPDMLQGARGTGTWMPLGYDFNLSFGQYYRDAAVGGKGLFSTNDWFKSHPFYGGNRVRCYSSSAMSSTINNGNDGFEAVWQSTKFRRLYLRRLRTLMDQELKAPGTPESEVPFMAKMRELADLMRADAASDAAKWPNDTTDSNIDVWASVTRPANMDAGVDDIWNNYVVPRREHLYVTHSVTNTAKTIGYGSRLNAGIPEAQSPIATLAPNITADLSNFANGVVVISNGNNEVVDMSGWVLKTAVEWTLPAGTVCDAQDAIYVVADRRAYVAAQADALTDQVIVGNAPFTDTAILQVFAADGTTQVLTTEPDVGDPVQSNLRFHTIYGSTLNGGGNEGEFIVITNVSASIVNLEGVEISCAKTKNGVTDAPKCRVVLGNVNLSAFGSIRLDQADYTAAGWEKITNGSIAMKIADKTGATVQIGELHFGLCDSRTDEGGYALQATRFDNETPLADSTDDWTAVFVEAAAPDAPVIGGGEGGVAPITVGASSVSINITNAKAGSRYGYKKSTTLAGLKDAPIVYQDLPADADGNLLIEIPRGNGESSCFYQIVVE